MNDSEPQAARFPIGKGTILLVEDEPFVRNFIKKSLEKAGFKILDAEDGNQAILAFDQHANGSEVFEQLRSRSATVPILFMSGFSEQSLPENLPKDFACDFIQKPFSPSDLIVRICDLIGI
jgi:two-component system cell cycle sensor histidine kinase/response regulator CckA